jgi:von Willebrand factor type A domain
MGLMAVACVWPGRAWAQLDESTGVAQVAVHPGYCELTVRRHWHNRGEEPTVVVDGLGDFEHGTVTGFRVDGRDEGGWVSGRPAEPRAALSRFVGQVAPGMPRLAGIAWMDLSRNTPWMQLSPIAPGKHAGIEYTFLIPTSYHGGRHHILLPWLSGSVRIVAPRNERGRVFVKDEPAERVMATKGDLNGDALSLQARQTQDVEGSLAVVPTGAGRSVVHHSFYVARELGRAPDRPHVVILVDRSWSRSAEDLDLDHKRIERYLDALPDDAAVAVVPFDRRAEPLFDGFLPPVRVKEEIAGLEFKRRNGSRLDHALETARGLLSSVASAKDHRVVILSDARTRRAFDTGDIQLTLRDALGHAVVSGRRAASGEAWEAAIEASGGLVWTGSHTLLANASGTGARELRPTPSMARLVRPQRVLDVELRVPGDEPEIHADLRAGEGIDSLVLRREPTPFIELRGRLWSRPLRVVLRASPADNARWAALALSSDLELSPKERERLAWRGHALSEHLSFVVGAQGRREEPTPDVSLRGVSGHGRSSHGSRAPRVRMGHGMPALDWVDLRARTRARAAQALRGCEVDSRAHVELETTDRELVDVLVKGLPQEASKCVAERLWAWRVPAAFAPVRSHRWRIDLPS